MTFHIGTPYKGVFYLTRNSGMTGKVSEMPLPQGVYDDLVKWHATPVGERPSIQEAFPTLMRDEREFILTGTTPQEWRDAFGDGE